MCRLPEEHWVAPAPSDANVAAAPSTLRRHRDGGLLDPALTARLAASVADGAEAQHGQGGAGAGPISGADSGDGDGTLQQQRRRLLSAAAPGGDAALTLVQADAKPTAGLAPREQQRESLLEAAGQLNLSAYRRGPAARKRHGAGGTDPTVCSLRCVSGTDSRLDKVQCSLNMPPPMLSMHAADYSSLSQAHMKSATTAVVKPCYFVTR